MKLHISSRNSTRFAVRSSGFTRLEVRSSGFSRFGARSGMATIVVVALIALVLVFMVGNARTLHYLSRNVRLIEEKQTRQLLRTPQTAPRPVHSTNAPPNLTNAPAAARDRFVVPPLGGSGASPSLPSLRLP